MKKRYIGIVITYILMLLSGFIGGPLLLALGVSRETIPGLWNVVSFLIGFVIILWLLAPEFKEPMYREERASIGKTLGWAFAGIPLVFIAQIVAATIERNVFGIESASQNTKMIVDITLSFPLLILVVAGIGPILEEIVFRKIIFGAIYRRTNFFIGALISSLVFAVVHRDFSHLFIYAAMGFTLSYLYVKTKRLIVPIIAHVSINSFVMLGQVVFRDQIEQFEKQAESIQLIIGGWL